MGEIEDVCYYDLGKNLYTVIHGDHIEIAVYV